MADATDLMLRELGKSPDEMLAAKIDFLQFQLNVLIEERSTLLHMLRHEPPGSLIECIQRLLDRKNNV